MNDETPTTPTLPRRAPLRLAVGAAAAVGILR
jgi:hypothetical protein